MSSRRFLLPFGVGLLLLLWMTVALTRMFVRERDESHAALAQEHEALRNYAHVVLQRALEQQLDQVRARIEAAERDPLEAAPELLSFVEGRQVLPLVTGPDTIDGRMPNAYGALPQERRRYASGAEGILFRHTLHQRLADARSDAEVTQAVRGLLNHLARYWDAPAREIPFRLRFLQTLVEKADPAPRLMADMLRDGLRGVRGRPIEGLQRALLRSRQEFGPDDFAFYADTIKRLSRESNVEYRRFEERTHQVNAQRFALAVPVDGGTLINGEWYVEGRGSDGAYGVRIELDSITDTISHELRVGGLLEARERLLIATPESSQRLASLLITIDSPPRLEREAASTRRMGVKIAMAWSLLALVLLIGLLMGYSAHRRQALAQSQVDFVSTISHELRTPVASLRLMAETLERRLKGTKEAKDFPTRMVAEADRLGFLVENVLSFNRLEKNAFSVELQDCTLDDLAEELRQRGAALGPIPVTLSTWNGDASFAADPQLMLLLLSNLVSNAAKYNDHAVAEVSFELQASDGRATILVRDNGSGIAKDEQGRIFDEFVRAGNGSQKGFGLGLAICRRIAALHQGTISLRESSAEGTVFAVELPGAIASRAMDADAPSKGAERGGEAGAGKATAEAQNAEEHDAAGAKPAGPRGEPNALHSDGPPNEGREEKG